VLVNGIRTLRVRSLEAQQNLNEIVKSESDNYGVSIFLAIMIIGMILCTTSLVVIIY
jgi:hypothetical protein